MLSSDFVNHLYDYRPNWTLLGPVTITYCTDPGLQLRDPAPLIGLSLRTC